MELASHTIGASTFPRGQRCGSTMWVLCLTRQVFSFVAHWLWRRGLCAVTLAICLTPQPSLALADDCTQPADVGCPIVVN
jgi:hypothetical protein